MSYILKCDMCGETVREGAHTGWGEIFGRVSAGYDHVGLFPGVAGSKYDVAEWHICPSCVNNIRGQFRVEIP